MPATSAHSYLLIALGSALGGIARFGCAALVANWIGSNFPWGTIVVNVLGSCVIGAVFGLTEPGSRWPLSTAAYEFLAIGVCGGYTTFSSFSLQTLDLLRRQQWWQAGANIFLSVAVCLVAVWLGYWLTTASQTR